MGTAFPHLFHILLQNELEVVSKWLCVWMRPTPFVSTTSLHKPQLLRQLCSFVTAIRVPLIRDSHSFFSSWLVFERTTSYYKHLHIREY